MATDRLATQIRPRSIPLLHVANRLFDTPLAIHPEKYEILVRAIAPRLGFGNGHSLDSSDLTGSLAVEQAEQLARLHDLRALNPLAFDDDSDEDDLFGSSSNAKKPYEITEDGCAVIKVAGTLVKRSSWMAALSGMTSYQSLGQQMEECVADANIRSILLDCRSPGGETHGLFELCEKLYSMRGSKPIFAIANDGALSAAYAIASCADQVWVTMTGALGSVGVFCSHVDASGMDEKNGLKFSYIHYGDKKVDGNPHEPLSKSARKDIQEETDRQGELFTKLVSRNRHASQQAVRDTQAGVFFADRALPLLGDRVGTLDDCYKAVVLKSGISLPEGRGYPANRGKKAETEKVTSLSAGTTTNTGALTPEAKAAVAAMTPVEAGKLHAELTAIASEGDPMAKTEASKELLELLGKKAEVKPAPVEVPVAAAPAIPATQPVASDPAPPADDKTDPVDKKPADKSKTCDPMPDEEEAKAKAAAVAAAAATTEANRIANAKDTGDKTMAEMTDAQAIAQLCLIGGCPALAATYIAEGKSLADVRTALIDRAAKVSAEPGAVDSTIKPFQGGSKLDIMLEAVASVKRQNPTMAQAEAWHRALAANPAIYDNYLEEKADAAAIPSHARQYSEKVKAKLAQMNLGTERLVLQNAGDAALAGRTGVRA